MRKAILTGESKQPLLEPGIQNNMKALYDEIALFYPILPVPSEPGRLRYLILRDVSLKIRQRALDMLARASVVTAQITNRLDVFKAENLRLNMQEMHVLIVSIVVVYVSALKVKNDSSIKNNKFIILPTDLLCSNLHESLRAYYG